MIINFAVLLMSIGWIKAEMNESPKLECLNDGMRMHFVPDLNRPFTGHIYVKGFFFSKNCHLDYTQHALTEPFYFHVPYNSTCQVHREKVNNPQGQAFSIVLIVQHHPLFLTQADKAFSVSCLYRDHPNELGQTLEVSDITTAQIQDEPPNADCSYEVLSGGINGQIVKFASIGDILVHKWSCETEEQGILVHSCFVRDGLGNEFPLLNERGCITDGSLIQQPLTYTSQLNTCYTPINAFKFADQMIVYFSCQITLCKKAENGCEGITPPVCEFQPLPDANWTSISTVTPRISTTPSGDESNETLTEITGEQSTTSQRPATTSIPDVTTEFSHLNETQNESQLLFKSSPWAASRHARSTKNSTQNELLTIDVQADRLIIFTKDENPALTSIRLNNMDKVCSGHHKSTNGTWVFLLFLFTFAVAFGLLWTQNRYFSQRLHRLQANASPYELSYMSATALNSKNSTPHVQRRSTVVPFSSDPFAR